MRSEIVRIGKVISNNTYDIGGQVTIPILGLTVPGTLKITIKDNKMTRNTVVAANVVDSNNTNLTQYLSIDAVPGNNEIHFNIKNYGYSTVRNIKIGYVAFYTK